MEAKGGIGVDVVTDLAAARSRWEALEAEGSATPFQSFAWVSTLAQTVGRSRSAETIILFVRDIVSGRDLMLLPLVRRSVGPIRIIELPDFGVSDYSARFCPGDCGAPDRFLAMWQVAMEAIPTADLIRINKVPEQVDRHANPFLQLPGLWPKETKSWSVDLPELWSDYETHRLSAKFKRNIRRSMKSLEAAGTVEYVVARDAITADEIFSVLCSHREARFKRLGRTDILGNAEYHAFYRQVINKGLASGPALLSALKVDGKIVATILGLYWRDSYFARLLDGMVGYDPEDPVTALGIGKTEGSYTRFLDKNGLKGARIGILRESTGVGTDPDSEDFKKVDAVFEKNIAELKAAGAVIVDPVVIPNLKALLAKRTRDPSIDAETLRLYLARNPDSPIKSGQDIGNSPDIDKSFPPFKADQWKKAPAPRDPAKYLDFLQAREELTFNVFKVMADNNLDAIVHKSVELQPGFIKDGINPPYSGARGILTLNTFLVYASTIAVPSGFTTDNLPVGITFFGRPYAEPTLLKLAYSYEQATHHRVPPKTTPALP